MATTLGCGDLVTSVSPDMSTAQVMSLAHSLEKMQAQRDRRASMLQHRLGHTFCRRERCCTKCGMLERDYAYSIQYWSIHPEQHLCPGKHREMDAATN